MHKLYKKAFTIVELVISMMILGIIIVIMSYNYIGVQNKSRTEENYHYANEVIQATERFKGLNTTGNRYPLKNDNMTGLIDKDKDFNNLLSKKNLENISFDKNIKYPSTSNSNIIYFESCYKILSDSEKSPRGVMVYYWDLVEKTVKNISVGKTDSDTDIICF